jgi:hypothetical protein
VTPAVLAVADSVRLVSRARAQAVLDPLDRAVFAVAGPLALLAQTFALAGTPGRFHRAAHRGVWYACRALATALAEVGWHQRRRMQASGLPRLSMRLVEARAAFAGSFADLRAASSGAALDPDITVGWPAGQALADEARAQGLDGIVWPSVRDPAGGAAYALLDPGMVRALRWGDCWLLPVASTETIPGTPTRDRPLIP